MRLTTGRERSRRYQREANDLLEEQLYAIQNLAQPQAPSDTRPRGTCPECHEMMLRGASTCPYCHTTGITWQTETIQEPVKTKGGKKPCEKCGGSVILFSTGNVRCLKCQEKLRREDYPHVERKPSQSRIPFRKFARPNPDINSCYKCGLDMIVGPYQSVFCPNCRPELNPKEYPYLFPK